MQQTITKPKIIYIAGAGHSGSTLLDMLLGSSPRVMGGGELYYLQEFFANTAPDWKFDDSGSTADQSLFWKVVFREKDHLQKKAQGYPLSITARMQLLIQGKTTNVPERYNDSLLFDLISKEYKALYNEPLEIIVDSSKNLSRLTDLVANADYEIHVLHLVRDLNGYVCSQKRKGRGVLASACLWFFTNLAIRRYCKHTLRREQYNRVTFKELTESTDELISHLNSKLDLAINTQNWVEQVQQKPSYRFAGNRMRKHEFAGIRSTPSRKPCVSRVTRYILAICAWCESIGTTAITHEQKQ